MRIKNKRTGAMYQSDTLVKSSSGFFWDKKNQMGAINLLFTEDDSWEEESVTPWISVKNRLPQTDDDLYIVLDVRMNPPGCGVCDFNPKTETWIDYGGNIVRPTHWMPIPPLESDDTDHNQLFVNDKGDWGIYRGGSDGGLSGIDFYGMPNDLNVDNYHKATVEELIEHFKGKEEI